MHLDLAGRGRRGPNEPVRLATLVGDRQEAADPVAPQVVETIQQVARTESIGDGKIFVLDLASATRIRTGESGDTAL